LVCHVRAAGTNWVEPRPEPAAETLAAYRPDDEPSPPAGNAPAPSLPADIAASIERVTAAHRAIITSQPIEMWRLETVRAQYESLLKQFSDNLSVEQALRSHLARVTRHEQAARAARTFQSILARSRRRDLDVAEVEQQLAELERGRPRPYRAVGFVQSSSRMADGRKLFALIGADGSTLAYLDVPPGIDINPLLARPVGIRGDTHYNEDLGARLITVRDMEALEARR
jgi:hypothetical protein